MKFRIILDNGAGIDCPLDETTIEVDTPKDDPTFDIGLLDTLDWTLTAGDTIHIRAVEE